MSMAMRIFIVLSAAYVASQFYRVANAVIAPELMADLSLSAKAMGVMTGAFFLGFAVAQIPVGVLLDRFGPRRTMSALFLLAALGSAGFALGQDQMSVTLARAAIGVGCAAGLMGSLVAIARWFPAERFAFLSSLLFALGGAGTLLGTTPLAWFSEWIGWRGSFWAMAGLTALAALLLFAVVRDHPPGAAEDQAPESWGEVARGLARVLGNRELWLVSAIQFTGYATLLAVIGLWAGRYFADVHGFDVARRGHALMALNLASLMGVTGYGRLDAHVASRKRLIIGAALLTAAILGVLALWPAPSLVAAMVLLLLFAGAGSSVMLLHAHARAVLPDHLVGRGLTLQNLAVFLGVFGSQAVTGVIVGAFDTGADGATTEAAHRAVFAALAVSLVVSAAIFSRAKDAR